MVCVALNIGNTKLQVLKIIIVGTLDMQNAIIIENPFETSLKYLLMENSPSIITCY